MSRTAVVTGSASGIGAAIASALEHDGWTVAGLDAKLAAPYGVDTSDPAAVSEALSRIADDIGPIDAVLIWHLYPNLGVDDRNQFDLLRDLPGGIPGLRRMVDQFHQHGVKVFFPFLAWDTGTRDEGASAAATVRSHEPAWRVTASC